MAKKKLKKTVSTDNTWRTILQSGIEGVSPQAKKRRFFSYIKNLFIIGGSVIFLISSIFVIYMNKQAFFWNFFPIVEHIEIVSDGPLNGVNLVPFIHLPENTTIMNVDIFKVKKRIESLGQVREAIVERQLPNTIKICINEYKPLVKILMKDKDKMQELLVSEEGEVFKAYGYGGKKLEHLPYLTGISLRKSGKSFKRVIHMDYLSELLRSAQVEVPHLYKYWKSISLEYCQNNHVSFGSFIKVKTSNMGEIIFAPEKFGLQLNRLNAIVTYASKQKLRTIERIDLSLENQAAVKVAKVP